MIYSELIGQVNRSNAGTRKSQLAIEYCYLTAEKSPNTWVFWVHAGSRARLEQGFREIANQANIRGRNDTGADIFKLVHNWLRDEKNAPWLLVLDNADDAAILSPSDEFNGQQSTPSDANDGCRESEPIHKLQQHLSEYLPPSKHGSVLVTSRTMPAARQIAEHNDIISIEPMVDTATELLRKKFGTTIASDDIDGVADLAKALDFMPLALVQAATYIRERAPRCSVRQYLKEYQQSDQRKTSLLNQGTSHLRRDKTASNSVLLTWQMTFEHLRTTHRSAAELLFMMSFFDCQGIQEALISPRNIGAGADLTEAFENDLQVLRDYSFVKITRDKQVFEMHSLVQLATRKWLECENEVDEWRKRFLSHLHALFSRCADKYWEMCEALFPHISATLAHQPTDEKSSRPWVFIMCRVAHWAEVRGWLRVQERLATIATNRAIEFLGEKSQDTYNIMFLAGRAKDFLGKYGEAESLIRQALSISEKIYGAEDVNTQAALISLFRVLRAQGKYREAEKMCSLSWHMKQKHFPPERCELMQSMEPMLFGSMYPSGYMAVAKSSSANMRHAMKIFDRSESIQRLLEFMEEVPEMELQDVLQQLNVWGNILVIQGRHKDAEEIFRKTLSLKETRFGLENPFTLFDMSRLATTIHNQRRFQEAEEMYKQVILLLEKNYTRRHPANLFIRHSLGVLFYDMKRYQEAESLLRETVTLRKEVLGHDCSRTRETTHMLAQSLVILERYHEAEQLTRENIILCETTLGSSHIDTARNMWLLAIMLETQHKFEESAVLYEKACHGFEIAFGQGCIQVLLCRGGYERAQKPLEYRSSGIETGRWTAEVVFHSGRNLQQLGHANETKPTTLTDGMHTKEHSSIARRSKTQASKIKSDSTQAGKADTTHNCRTPIRKNSTSKVARAISKIGLRRSRSPLE